MKRDHKPRLVIITGAGASADVVSTAKCLTHAPELKKDSWLRTIEKDLQEGNAGYTFEDVIEQCVKLAPTTEYYSGFHSVEAYFQSILDVIVRELDCSVAHRPELLTILETLSSHFSLTLATLNWDDLPLQSSIPWYSGFVDGRFNARYLDQAAESEHRILWLHGSVHFAVHNHGTPTIVWNANRQSILNATLLPTGPDSDGQSNLLGPIITGREKDGQLLRRPFLDYRFMLYRDLLEADALLMIGYSGADPDLNHLIHAALWEDPQGRKNIVRVDWSTPGTSIPKIFEWFRKTCGAHLRFCAPPCWADITPNDGLVQVSSEQFGNQGAVLSTATYVDLGGLQSAASHVLEVQDALCRGPDR